MTRESSLNLIVEASKVEIQDTVDFTRMAEDLARRSVILLGSGNEEEGLKMWFQRGYSERIKRLLQEKNKKLYALIVIGSGLELLDALDRDDWEMPTENTDPVLIEELAAVKNKYHLKRAAAIGGLISVALVGYLEYDRSNKIKKLKQEEGRETQHEPYINYDQLLELDPGATREGIDYIIKETLPKSVQTNVASIGFIDRKRRMDSSYGPKLHRHSESAATAEGGIGADGVDIIFWRGMQRDSVSWKIGGQEIDIWKGQLKENLSNSVWNNVILHEGVGHGLDWGRNGDLTLMESEVLKNRIYLRVIADDRFRSQYVEDISNDDKYEELNLKAEEYWAEIVRAYLVNDPNLPETDSEIVKEYLAKGDPTFDRDAALAKRLNKIKEMNAAAGFKELVFLQDKYKDWISQKHKGVDNVENIAMQKMGRAELVSFYNSLSKNEQILVRLYIDFCKQREIFLAVTKPADKETNELAKFLSSGRALVDMLGSATIFEGVAKRFISFNPVNHRQEQVETLISKVDSIINKYDLALGGFRGSNITAEEQFQLFPEPLSEASIHFILSAEWTDGMLVRLKKLRDAGVLEDYP